MLAKLKPEAGLYLIHWSTSHLHRLILTVAQRDQVGVGRGVLGRGWARSLPGPLLTAATPAAASCRLQALRACACGSSLSSSRPGQSCWRAGAGLSPACGT